MYYDRAFAHNARESEAELAVRRESPYVPPEDEDPVLSKLSLKALYPQSVWRWVRDASMAPGRYNQEGVWVPTGAAERLLPQARAEGLAARRRAAQGGGLDLAPPGGESPRQVQQRLRPWLRTVTVPTLALSHKGIIRAIYALATGWTMLGKPAHQLHWDCVQLFSLDNAGHPHIERLNIPLTPHRP